MDGVSVINTSECLTTTSAFTWVSSKSSSSNLRPSIVISTSPNQKVSDTKLLQVKSEALLLGDGTNNKFNNVDECNRSDDTMLMTPVFSAPKQNYSWSESTSPLENVTGCAMRSNELPMDSDIGLRSPCDGVLAKRRMFKSSKIANSYSNATNCSNSDSNGGVGSSFDCKPHDLSTRWRSMEEEEELLENRSSNQLKDISDAPAHDNASFRQPIRRQIKSDILSELLVNVYQPSPLLVPSPNWSAVERNFGIDTFRTPKFLDNTVFDFLGLPPTPRTKFGVTSSSHDHIHSPSHEAGRYTGRDQILSPKLSPRFPIPEIPTDLSSNGRSCGGYNRASFVDNSIQASQAEDLSTSRAKVLSSAATSNFRQESFPEGFSDGPNRRHIKTEIVEQPNEIYTGASTRYHQRMTENEHFISHVYSPFYIPQQYDHFYNGSAAAALRYRQFLQEGGQVDGMENYLANFHANRSGGTVGPEMLNVSSHQLNAIGKTFDTVKMACPTKPSEPSWATTQQQSQWPNQSRIKSENSSSISQPDRPSISEPKCSKNSSVKERAKKRQKSKIHSNEDPNDDQTRKQVYSCPHCKRSYDWNYNLNRHLKYECGKENAFQCSKCGRKFPHKQNCVYHLKRKHKILCNSIDDYVAAGLVIFRGRRTTTGQQAANPEMI